jgi:hypothetical protein
MSMPVKPVIGGESAVPLGENLITPRRLLIALQVRGRALQQKRPGHVRFGS